MQQGLGTAPASHQLGPPRRVLEELTQARAQAVAQRRALVGQRHRRLPQRLDGAQRVPQVAGVEGGPEIAAPQPALAEQGVVRKAPVQPGDQRDRGPDPRRVRARERARAQVLAHEPGGLGIRPDCDSQDGRHGALEPHGREPALRDQTVAACDLGRDALDDHGALVAVERQLQPVHALLQALPSHDRDPGRRQLQRSREDTLEELLVQPFIERERHRLASGSEKGSSEPGDTSSSKACASAARYRARSSTGFFT